MILVFYIYFTRIWSIELDLDLMRSFKVIILLFILRSLFNDFLLSTIFYVLVLCSSILCIVSLFTLR